MTNCLQYSWIAYTMLDVGFKLNWMFILCLCVYSTQNEGHLVGLTHDAIFDVTVVIVLPVETKTASKPLRVTLFPAMPKVNHKLDFEFTMETPYLRHVDYIHGATIVSILQLTDSSKHILDC